MYIDIIADIILAALLLLYFFRGWDNGLSYALINIAGVVGSYLISVIATPLISPIVSEQFEIAQVVAFVLTWTVIFLTIVFIFWILKRTALKNITYHVQGEEDYHLPLYSKALGGVISLLLGTVVLSIAILLYGIMSGGMPNSPFPDISGSYIVGASSKVSKQVAYAGIKKVTGSDKIASRFSRVASKPHVVMTAFRKVVGSKKFRAVISDQALIDAAIKGHEVDIMNNKSLNIVLADAELMKWMRILGIVEKDEYLKIPFRTKLAKRIVAVAQKIDKAGEGSVIKKNMNELRHAGLLQKSKIDKLLVDKRFHEVIDQVLFSDFDATEPASK